MFCILYCIVTFVCLLFICTKDVHILLYDNYPLINKSYQKSWEAKLPGSHSQLRERVWEARASISCSLGLLVFTALHHTALPQSPAASSPTSQHHNIKADSPPPPPPPSSETSLLLTSINVSTLEILTQLFNFPMVRSEVAKQPHFSYTMPPLYCQPFGKQRSIPKPWGLVRFSQAGWEWGRGEGAGGSQWSPVSPGGLSSLKVRCVVV